MPKTFTMPQCLLQNIPRLFYRKLIAPPRIATDRDEKYLRLTIWNNCRGNIMGQFFTTNIAVLHAGLDCAVAASLQSKTGRAMRPAAPTSSRRDILRRTEPVRPTIFPISRAMRPRSAHSTPQGYSSADRGRSALPLISKTHIDHAQCHADRNIKRLG